MDTVYQIFEYLPLIYKTPTDTEYFNFLIHSIEQNYEIKNYHFALVALHMIYMGIVYHYIYVIFKTDKKRFEYVLIGFHDRLNIKNIYDISWHSFSNENESTIFQFYQAIGISKDEIGQLKAPVKLRNDILHTNGTFIYNEDQFENQAQIYLRNLQKIDQYCFNEYKKLLFQFLNELKVSIRNKEEALQYLEEYFLKEFEINLNIMKNLSKIDKSQYPEKKKIFYYVIKDYNTD